jgi:hypothetical protein
VVGKILVSEWAESGSRGGIVGAGRVFFVIEGADPRGDPAGDNLCRPPVGSCSTDTFEARGCAYAFALARIDLRAGGGEEIATAIVQAIAVLMDEAAFIGAAQNPVMHEDVPAVNGGDGEL